MKNDLFFRKHSELGAAAAGPKNRDTIQPFPTCGGEILDILMGESCSVLRRPFPSSFLGFKRRHFRTPIPKSARAQFAISPKTFRAKSPPKKEEIARTERNGGDMESGVDPDRPPLGHPLFQSLSPKTGSVPKRAAQWVAGVGLADRCSATP